MPKDFCPYKGLQPYTEGDRAFFFGRERDAQVVISNLYAAPLTVFYGASGVGKSSVLLAGAVPLLKQERNVSIVVFRNWQDPNFLSQLKQCTLEAVSSVAGRQIEADFSLSLDEFLSSLQRTARGLLFFIFDQFEEYFLYNPIAANAESFESEFALAVNRRDVNVNFLVSMREDGLSKLDRFQSRIPTLMSNMLRLEHLDRAGARDAIVGPLEVYNRQLPDGQTQVSIEDPLVKAILNDLRGVKVTSEQTSEGALQDSSPGSSNAEIETPLLQMVMTRLWDEERQANSNVLRLATFEKLGRAANIARTHLDNMMARLSDSERNDAARVLRYMVTPSRTKIAQEAGALASWAELPEAQVQAILTRLSGPDMRILRTVQAPGRPDQHEIFHDVLAGAILDWRRRYDALRAEERVRQEEQDRIAEEREKAERLEQKKRSRRQSLTIGCLSIVVFVMALVVGFAVWQYVKANHAVAEAKQKNIELESDRHLQKGVAFTARRRFDEAIQEYDEALRLNPNNLPALNNRGYALLKKGDLGQVKYEESIKVLTEVTVKDPKYIWGHYNLAQAYWKALNSDQALKEGLEVLNLDPSFCETFKGDPNYRWFTDTPAYAARCQRK